MKRIIIIALGIFFAISALLFSLFSNSSKLSIKPPTPEDSGTMRPISKQSTIFVPVDISSKLIADAVEQSVPRSVNERRGLSISGVKDERVTITGNRSNLNTLTSENGIAVSGSMNNIRARVQGCIRLIVGCKSFSQSARGNVTFKLSSKPEFKPDWKIDPVLGYNFRVPNMSASIAGGIGSVSLRGKTTEALNGAANRIKNDYSNNFPLNQKFKEGAEKLWNDAHQVIEVYDSPKTWLIVKPNAISVSQPQFSADAIRLGIGVDIENSIIVSDLEPEIKLKPFPEVLEIRPEISSDNLKFSLPIAIDFQALNSELASQLQKNTPKIEEDFAGEKIVIELTGASISPSGNGVIIEVELKSRSRGFLGKKLSGSVFVVATPILDKASGQLRFSDFDYHVDTKSTLTNAAAYLLKPAVMDDIKNNLIVDLTALEKDAIAKAKIEITRLNTKIPDGVALKLDPTKAELSDVIVSRDYFHVILDVAGRIDIAVDDKFLLPAE